MSPVSGGRLSVPGIGQHLEGNEVNAGLFPASLKQNGQSSRLLSRFCHYQICVLIEKFIPAAVWHLEGSDNCGRLRTSKEAAVLFWQTIKVAWNRALMDGFSARLPTSLSEPCRRARTLVQWPLWLIELCFSLKGILESKPWYLSMWPDYSWMWGHWDRSSFSATGDLSEETFGNWGRYIQRR